MSKGNAFADRSAKAASLVPVSPDLSASSLDSQPPDLSVSEIQTFATPEERRLWAKCGCTHTPLSWFSSDKRPCLPKHFFPWFATWSHGLDHVSKRGMLDIVSSLWFTKGFSVIAERCCKNCLICATNNPGRPVNTVTAAHPLCDYPFEHLMMDFIELSLSEGKKYCLVVVDMFSKWVEAFPTKSADSSAVAKALLTEIFPRWGIPGKNLSDNGTHFVNKALAEVSETLGFQLKTHCAYHPLSGGAVERENGTLKSKLEKCCEETGLSWIKALPLVLMYMRMRRRARTNLSPYEILFGRPPRMATEPIRNQNEHNMLTYCQTLSKTILQNREATKTALQSPAPKPLHLIQPVDWVLIKEYRRKHWRIPR